MRGRKPTPTRLKLLKGNPGQRRLNAREPSVPAAIPEAPEWLEGISREKWDELTEKLAGAQILTELDADVLALYCETWAEYRAATDEIRSGGRVVKAPSGYPMTSPYVTIRNKALIQLRTLEAELGLTPSARSRLIAAVPAAGAVPGRDDKWAGILP